MAYKVMLIEPVEFLAELEAAIEIGKLQYACQGKLYNITRNINTIDDPDYMKISDRATYYRKWHHDNA